MLPSASTHLCIAPTAGAATTSRASKISEGGMGVMSLASPLSAELSGVAAGRSLRAAAAQPLPGAVPVGVRPFPTAR
jgi:hypothetical protein